MSASIVRQALELDILEGDKSTNRKKSIKNKKKNKLIQKKKQQLSGDKFLKQNLKILKVLDSAFAFYTSTKKPQKRPDPEPALPQSAPDSIVPIKKSKKSSKKRKTDTNSSVFTDEDFAKFESEYFVTD